MGEVWKPKTSSYVTNASLEDAARSLAANESAIERLSRSFACADHHPNVVESNVYQHRTVSGAHLVLHRWSYRGKQPRGVCALDQ
jgi:hypothetical protein